MSQENANRLRVLYSEWANGKVRVVEDLFASDAVFEPVWPRGTVAYRGPEEIGAHLRESLAGWPEFRVELEELVEGDEAIVVTERRYGKPKHSRGQIAFRFYAIWNFRDGRVIRVRWETDPTKALQAAGLRQHSDAWDEGYSSTAGLPFDDIELESRIVWIWGSPRTGSTWLLRQICHPAQIEEHLPLGFALPPGYAGELRAVPYDEFMISPHIAPGGEPVRVNDSYWPTTLNTLAGDRSSYALSKRFADIWGPELRRLVLVRLAAAVDRARRAGIALAPLPLLVIKEVSGSHAANDVMKLFPRSKLLFLVRDGRDVIDSLLHAQQPGGWWVQTEAEDRLQTSDARLDWVREESMKWACNVDMVRFAFDRHSPELRLELRYEDLRTATRPAITQLFDWLGLPTEAELIDEVVAAHSFENIPAERRGATRPIRFAQPGLWRKHLSDEEQQVAIEIMGSRLAALGYEPE